MDTCTCMAESLHCSPKTITTLLIANISMQNKKLKEKEDADAWIRGGAMGLRASSSGLGHGGSGRRRQGDSRGSGLGPQVLSEMETLGGSDEHRGASADWRLPEGHSIGESGPEGRKPGWRGQLGVRAQVSDGCRGMVSVGEGRHREGEERRLGRNKPCQAERGIPATSRRENQGGVGRAWVNREEGHAGCNRATMPSIPSSLTEKAEGGSDHAVIPWRVGWVGAGICTLGWTPLAGRQEPAQGQDQLMQRGPIVAGPAEGMQLCWPLPRGSIGERGGRLSGQAGAVCSGSALTQEGNTPFMEAPRALGSLPVPEVGEGPQRMLLLRCPSQAPRSQGQMGRWEPRLGEHQALGFQSVLSL